MQVEKDSLSLMGETSSLICDATSSDYSEAFGLQLSDVTDDGATVAAEQGRQVLLGRCCALGDGLVAKAFDLALSQSLGAISSQELIVAGSVHGQANSDVGAVTQGFASAFRGLGETPDDLAVFPGSRVQQSAHEQSIPEDGLSHGWIVVVSLTEMVGKQRLS